MPPDRCVLIRDAVRCIRYADHFVDAESFALCLFDASLYLFLTCCLQCLSSRAHILRVAWDVLAVVLISHDFLGTPLLLCSFLRICLECRNPHAHFLRFTLAVTTPVIAFYDLIDMSKLPCAILIIGLERMSSRAHFFNLFKRS